MFGAILKPDVAVVEERIGQCQSCAHRDHLNTPTKCAAFPEGIPLVILIGMYDHTHPYLVDGEVADQGLMYLPDDSR